MNSTPIVRTARGLALAGRTAPAPAPIVRTARGLALAGREPVALTGAVAVRAWMASPAPARNLDRLARA